MMDLADLKRIYTEARDNTDTARREADTAQDYYDCKQLSAKQTKVLRERKQPEIFVNRIAPAVNGMLGVLEQGQADPRAFPRNNEDDNASEIATDALRYSAEKCRWQRTKLQSAKNYLIGGIAAVIAEVSQEGDPWPRIIRQGEFFYDPFSRDPDFEDAHYMGVAKWMYVADVSALYPEAAISLEAVTPSSVSFDDDDKPLNVWSDSTRKRVLVVEMYINRGGWRRVVFYGGAVLEDTESPYHDEQGTPTNPIVAQSCFVDRDNARYGIVKAMIPIQDEINMRRSRLLHMVNSRQVRQTDMSASVDAAQARAEAARPDGIIPYGYEPASTSEMAMGQINLLQESKNELERMGPNPAVLGQGASSASGRAQLVQQQAGLTELTPALGGIEDFELRVYRQMWMRIKQFWNEPKMIRVTDDVGAAKFLQVNEPIIQEVQGIVQGPNGPQIGMQQVQVGVRNRPSEMDMDIIIDAVADTANVQQEQFAELVKLAGIYGPQEVPFDDLLKASNLPRKRELIEQRETRKQEAAQGGEQGQQMQQAVMQVELGAKQAKTALDVAKTAQTEADTQIAILEAGIQIGQGMPAAGAM